MRRVVHSITVGWAGACFGAALLSGPAEAQTAIRTERVQFSAGSSSKAITGQLKGDETVDYLVKAAAGQTMTVTMKGSNTASYYNVLPPGSNDAAMFNGSMGGDFNRLLPADGDYKIRVYLMRSAARRKEATAFTLTVGVTGKPLPPLPASQDALVKGTTFHARGTITCVVLYDPTPRQCEASVVRRGRDGTATVEIRGPNGFRRIILFVAGKVAASDSTEAASMTRTGDVNKVSFATDERYELPDALIIGG